MKTKLCRYALCLLAVLGMCISGIQVSAVGDASLYAMTPYTGLVVTSGKRYEFEVTLENKSRLIRQVELGVTELPAGWAAYFDASGRNITDLLVKPEGIVYCKFVITVPEDTQSGIYLVTSSYSDETGTQDITYKLTVDNEQQSDLRGKLDVQFPELTGPSGAVFTYRVTYRNSSSANQSFSLASQTPEGWNVSFKPMYESKTVASIVVDAYGTQVLDVEIAPPANVEAANYTVPIAFISEAETITTELALRIEGAFGLTVSTPDGRLNADAYAGKETLLPLVVTNSGTAQLRDIALANTLPQAWSASFDTPVIPSLEPGESVAVQLALKPASRAITGDYIVTVVGSNYGVRSAAEIRVMVKTPVYWGFVGLACIAAVLVFISVVFRKFGRR